MTSEFRQDGVAFCYPANWTLEREEAADGWTVTIQSPGTAFAVVRLDSSLPTTEEVAQTALDALRADYAELEAEPCVDMLAGEMAIGHDINFFSLDLSNTCWTRSIYAGGGTLLVLCQVSDLDQADYEPVLRAICQSLQVDVE
jgi:hypothetical protein